MIFGAFIALLKGSEPPVEFGSNLNESEFINTTVQVGEEKSGFTYVSTPCPHFMYVVSTSAVSNYRIFESISTCYYSENQNYCFLKS